jgi:hypothetical protein
MARRSFGESAYRIVGLIGTVKGTGTAEYTASYNTGKGADKGGILEERAAARKSQETAVAS